MNDDTGSAPGRLLQPGLEGEAAAGRDRTPSSSGSSTPTGASASSRTPSSTSSATGPGGSCRSTRPPKPRASPAGSTGSGSTRPSEGRARSRPAPARFLDDLGPDRARRSASAGIHHPENFAEKSAARRRLAFDELLRLQLEVVMRRHETRARLPGGSATSIRPDGPRGSGPRLSISRAAPVRADKGAAARPRRDRPGPRRPAADEPATPGRRRIGKDRRRRMRPAHRHPGRLPGRLHGADRGARRAALHRRSACCSTASRCPIPDVSGGSRPLSVVLLTSRTPAAERTRTREGLADGFVDLVVGTHALLTDDVRFSALGVVVIDEQHRFGVEQRAALQAKGRDRGRRRMRTPTCS